MDTIGNAYSLRKDVMALCILHLFTIVAAISAEGAFEAYQAKRERILRQEAEMCLGGKLILTDKEERVDQILMMHKLEEVNRGFLHPDVFNFSHHYFSYKDKIPQSALYQMIQRMPKGAALHVHDTALLGPDYLLNLTYLDQLFICFDRDRIQLQFSLDTPNSTCSSSWKLLNAVREASVNKTMFDRNIRKHFTIVCEQKELNKTSDVWESFKNTFKARYPLLTYRPVWEKYLYDALKTFREDNIMYIELRSGVPLLYELNGTTHDSVASASIYKKVIDRFLNNYPDFIGVKIIYARNRLAEYSAIEDYLNVTRQLKAELGDFVAGFDLVGQEDIGRPLRDFLPLLVTAQDELQYFFHAGESNWWGTTSDENLVDAVLLGSRRLGHAYALLKHPALERRVRRRRVGLEVNVISNQVLGLVADVRNHPLAHFLARDLPVVLSSDDPGLWEAAPLSHDYYVALVGVASRHAGLRTLKQLALNSLALSALAPTQRGIALRAFHERWEVFIDSILAHI